MTTSPRLRFVSVVMYTLAALCGVLAAGIYAQNTSLISSNCRVNCGSFFEYVREDPVCAIDPSCVSVIYDYGGGVRRWMGTKWWSLPQDQEAPPSWQALAPINYILFLAVTVGAAVAASRRLAGRNLRVVLVGLSAWSITAVCFWIMAAANQPSRGIDPDPYSAALIVEGFWLVLVTVGATFAARRW